MYFIERGLFDRPTNAGLEVPSESRGIFQLRGVPGVLINPDALTLEQLNVHANTLAQTPNGASAFQLTTTEEGLWNVVLAADTAATEPAATPRTRTRRPRTAAGRGDDDTTADLDSDRPAGTRRQGQARAQTQAPVFTEIRRNAPRSPGRVGPGTAPGFLREAIARTAQQLAQFYGPRMTSRIKLVQPSPDSPADQRGLPDPEQHLADPAHDKLIVLGATPGTGQIDYGTTARVRILDNQNRDGVEEIAVQTADIPAGMTPVRVEDVTVGCYDARMLVLFVPHAGLLQAIAPTWLENFTNQPETRTDSQSAIDHLIAARRRTENADRDVDSLRSTIAHARQTLTVARARRQAFDQALEHQRPPIDPEPMVAQIEQLMAGTDWYVETNGGSPTFQLRQGTVRDPRDGRPRELPGRPELTLAQMLRQNAPFRNNPSLTRNHPRLFGSGFLSPEVETAFEDCVASGDIVGALDLVKDVLTNFNADDADVVALDGWDVVETHEEGTETA